MLYMKNHSCIFMIDTKDTHRFDLKVRIEGPNSVIKTTLDRISNTII